jgi:hypothetical protein
MSESPELEMLNKVFKIVHDIYHETYENCYELNKLCNTGIKSTDIMGKLECLLRIEQMRAKNKMDTLMKTTNMLKDLETQIKDKFKEFGGEDFDLGGF